MKKQMIYLSLMIPALFACTEHSEHPLALSEQLHGKSPEKQQEILSSVCLNDAEKITGRPSMWKSGPHGATYIHDTSIDKMKGICREMTENYLIQNPSQTNHLQHECDALLQTVPVGTSNTVAIGNMRQVCGQMTKNPF